MFNLILYDSLIMDHYEEVHINYLRNHNCFRLFYELNHLLNKLRYENEHITKRKDI